MKKKLPTPIERLTKRLNEEGYPVKKECFYRTHAGYWQKTSGIWSWGFTMDGCNGIYYIGSQQPVSAFLGKDKIWDFAHLSFGQIEIDAYTQEEWKKLKEK